MTYSLFRLCIAGGLLVLPGVSHSAAAPLPLPPVTHARASHLVEPRLKLARRSPDRPNVALTFDACMGKVDHRILDMLVANRIPATIFVTARWLKTNAAAFAILMAHPDLFEIEDHGANHIPAVDQPASIYGIQSAGTPQAVADEVQGGADAIVKAGAPRPSFFRGATAKYTRSSIRQIEALGYQIAGYSVNGDGGSVLSRNATEKRFLSARDGDVIIAHINQPTHEAGEGVVAGVLGLQKRGYNFVLLRDQPDVTDLTAHK